MSAEPTDFERFPNKPQGIQYYLEKLDAHFDFLNHQTQTRMHEVDIKRFEARQCVVLGLGISAIAMTGVLLEDFLKGMLKRHRFMNSIDRDTEPSLDDFGDASLEAVHSFGGINLHNAIQKARKEGLITEPEESRLLELKETVRNAFIHSDNTKVFDTDSKSRVSLISTQDGIPKVKETRMMGILELMISHGIMQKQRADEQCLEIFQEVDQMIVSISKRFWLAHHR